MIKKISNNLTDIVLILVIIAVFNIFFPYNVSNLPELQKGDIAPKDIVAPFTFPILKNKDVLEDERQNAYNSVPPVLNYDETRTERIKNEYKMLSGLVDSLKNSVKDSEEREKLFARRYSELSSEIRKLLLSNRSSFLLDNTYNIFSEVLEAGIISEKDEIPFGKEKKIILKRGDNEEELSVSDIYEKDEAINKIKENIIKSFSSNSFLLKYGIELSQYFLRSNIDIDNKETQLRREKASREVPETVGMVLEGEIVVRAHDIVDQKTADKLRSLKTERENTNTPVNETLRILIKNLIFVVILILYFIFINTYFKKLNIKFKDKIFIASIVMLNLVVYSVFYQFVSVEYLIPVILSAAVFSLVYSRTFAMVTTVFITGFLLIYSGLRLHGLLALIITAIYTIYMIRTVDKRAQFLNVILKIGAIILFFTVCIGIYREAALMNIVYNSLTGVSNIVVSIILVMLILPVIEKALGRISNITLLELSDLNNPLLKLVAENASGTFHHSLIVSNMSESAAKAVDANELMARIGAYYHDIGKTLKPEYFIENQGRESNPHESLPPELSAEIIRDHVLNGIEIAEKNRLPEQIVRFIRTHHGDSLIDYFYDKAVEKKSDVNAEKFRYPGPPPRTKEETIVMLADSSEAAVKSIPKKDEGEIRRMVEYIFKKKFNENQMRDSELSIKELNTVREIFIRILESVYHARVEYKEKNVEQD
ncbi:MAG: HDIG domain-containing protein [candidate division WOR-3 bacterium]|nr:HDIG domain-containing protein [candidate division WOR-3 bacterium]